MGIPLERNNSGACLDATGRMIRYGLANDSAQKNKRIKSGDLIGVLPLAVMWSTGQVVGIRNGSIPKGPHTQLGVFLSVECKHELWHGGDQCPIRPEIFNDRETAQQTWIDHIRKYGGVAGFARSVAEFERLVREAGFNA